MPKTSKNRNNKKNRTVKIRHFKDLKQQKIAKKGVQISFEKASSLGEGEKNKPKGDIVKKYVNGKLVAQKFVTEAKLKQLVKKHSKVHGGKSKTNQAAANDPMGKDPMGKDPQGKDPQGKEQVIVIQDGTNMKQSFTSGIGHGIGFGIGIELVKGVINGIFGSDD